MSRYRARCIVPRFRREAFVTSTEGNARRHIRFGFRPLDGATRCSRATNPRDRRSRAGPRFVTRTNQTPWLHAGTVGGCGVSFRRRPPGRSARLARDGAGIAVSTQFEASLVRSAKGFEDRGDERQAVQRTSRSKPAPVVVTVSRSYRDWASVPDAVSRETANVGLGHRTRSFVVLQNNFNRRIWREDTKVDEPQNKRFTSVVTKGHRGIPSANASGRAVRMRRPVVASNT